MRHRLRFWNRKPGTLATLAFLAAAAFPAAAVAANDRGPRDADYLSDEELAAGELEGGEPVADPLEPLNRAIFKFNDFVYMNALKPLAEGYDAVMPDAFEQGIGNFFTNAQYPARLAGNLLQGRFRGAAVETGRFVVNTTAGVGGLASPADEIEMLEPIPEEDIGQALGSWGVGEGFYVVVPLFGASTARGLVGTLGDRAVSPLDEPYSVVDEWEWQLGLSGAEFINRSPDLIDRYVEMKSAAIDPYSSLKNGYIQLRRKAVAE